MGKIKSLLIKTRFSTALRAHKCKANSKHLISKGDFRLEVKNDRNWDKYCRVCSSKIFKENNKNWNGKYDEFTTEYENLSL